jgi:DNA-binding NarL/FixJ family response regulator
MLSVVIVAADPNQRTVLQGLVDDTSVASKVHTCISFPFEASDPVMLGLQAANPDVLLIDIPSDNPATAMRTIELLHEELPDSAVFAIGNLNREVIINAMRAGAREFIERSTTSDDLLEAFARLITRRR